MLQAFRKAVDKGMAKYKSALDALADDTPLPQPFEPETPDDICTVGTKHWVSYEERCKQVQQRVYYPERPITKPKEQVDG